MSTVTITGRALGRKRPLFADHAIPPPPSMHEGGGVTLRQIIEHVVRHEVEAFVKRQEDRTVFRVLTARQIEQAADQGKIESGGSDVGVQDVDEAVAAAIQAFEDGIYLVAVDEQDQRDLDRELFLKPDSRITFIRLTLLAGG